MKCSVQPRFFVAKPSIVPRFCVRYSRYTVKPTNIISTNKSWNLTLPKYFSTKPDTSKTITNVANQAVDVSYPFDVSIATQRYNQLKEEAQNLLDQFDFENAEHPLLGSLQTCAKVIAQSPTNAGVEKMRKEKANTHLRLSLVYSHLRKLDAAFQNSQDGLEVAQSLYTADSVELVQHYLQYGEVCALACKNLQTGINYVKQAVSILEKAPLVNPVYLASALGNLAGLYATAKMWKEAKETSRRSLDMFVQHVGVHHPFSEKSYQNHIRILIANAVPKQEVAKLRDEWEEKMKKHYDEIQQAATTASQKIDIEGTLDQWAKQPIKKAFDPPGMFLPPEIAVKEYEEFLNFYKQKGVTKTVPFSVVHTQNQTE